MTRIELNGGKYTIINELDNGGGFIALRYGEEWRSLAGDNLVLALFHKIEELIEENERLQYDSELLSCLEACGVDNWCGWDDAMQMMSEEDE